MLQTAAPFPIIYKSTQNTFFLLQVRDVCERYKAREEEKGGGKSEEYSRVEDFVTLVVVLTSASLLIRSSSFHTLRTLSSSRNRVRGLAQIFEDGPV
jgi:hypothetical protein